MQLAVLHFGAINCSVQKPVRFLFKKTVGSLGLSGRLLLVPVPQGGKVFMDGSIVKGRQTVNNLRRLLVLKSNFIVRPGNFYFAFLPY
jgi:hypothetical protein